MQSFNVNSSVQPSTIHVDNSLNTNTPSNVREAQHLQFPSSAEKLGVSLAQSLENLEKTHFVNPFKGFFGKGFVHAFKQLAANIAQNYNALKNGNAIKEQVFRDLNRNVKSFLDDNGDITPEYFAENVGIRGQKTVSDKNKEIQQYVKAFTTYLSKDSAKTETDQLLDESIQMLNQIIQKTDKCIQKGLETQRLTSLNTQLDSIQEAISKTINDIQLNSDIRDFEWYENLKELQKSIEGTTTPTEMEQKYKNLCSARDVCQNLQCLQTHYAKSAKWYIEDSKKMLKSMTGELATTLDNHLDSVYTKQIKEDKDVSAAVKDIENRIKNGSPDEQKTALNRLNTLRLQYGVLSDGTEVKGLKPFFNDLQSRLEEKIKEHVSRKLQDTKTAFRDVETTFSVYIQDLAKIKSPKSKEQLLTKHYESLLPQMEQIFKNTADKLSDNEIAKHDCQNIYDVAKKEMRDMYVNELKTIRNS
ncbi:MAG: hypothetical protein IJ793_01805 [Opitutales bacterium]|nr:hypothetical protein [Opitutales bacterium]